MNFQLAKIPIWAIALAIALQVSGCGGVSNLGPASEAEQQSYVAAATATGQPRP
jgi:uncharacterized protein YceK